MSCSVRILGEFAFVPHCWDESALALIANTAAAAGDVRVGLHLLRDAGMAAEDTNSPKILTEHAKAAIAKIHDFSIKPESDLADDSKAILNIIKSQTEGRIGTLFKLYQENGGDANYKTFQRRIERLSQGGFIDTTKIVGGKDGTTTIVKWKNKSLTDF